MDFFQSPELEETEAKRDVVAEIAEIAQMVCEPLAFKRDRAQQCRARRNVEARRRFDRHGVGPGERDRGIAADAAGELCAFLDAERLEALFNPLVLIAQPLFQAQYLLADSR